MSFEHPTIVPKEENSTAFAFLKDLFGHVSDEVFGEDRKKVDTLLTKKEEALKGVLNKANGVARGQDEGAFFQGQTDGFEETSMSPLDRLLAKVGRLFDRLLGGEAEDVGEKVAGASASVAAEAQPLESKKSESEKLPTSIAKLLSVATAAVHAGESMGASNCWDWVKKVYDQEGLNLLQNQIIFRRRTPNSTPSQGTLEAAYTSLKPGAHCYIFNNNSASKNPDNPTPGQHSVLFEKWTDPALKIAQVVSWPGRASAAPREHYVCFEPLNLPSTKDAAGNLVYQVNGKKVQYTPLCYASVPQAY